MATMYPAKVETEAQNGEKLVYEELRKLPDDWIVFHDCWQHYRSGDEYVNYEADFIVLVPRLGIVCIEVKDWVGAIRIEGGEWQHLHDGKWIGMGRKYSPLNQAFLAGKHLRAGLAQRGIFPPKGLPEVRCLAIMLNQVPRDIPGPISQDASILRRCGNPTLDTLYVCGHESLRSGLQNRLESLFIFNNDNLTPERMRAIVDFIAPSLLFRLDVAGYAEVMERAAAPIRNLLPMLDESSGGILVQGCAGSGKTVMACNEAARLAARFEEEGTNARILMLCFNRQLATALIDNPLLAPYTRGEAPRIDISTLHSLAIDRYIKPQGLTHLLDNSGNDILSKEALRVVSEQLEPTYAAIFVDEAQDFKCEWWDAIIRRLLLPDGRLRVFADANQNLFRSEGSTLPNLPTRVNLSTNLRNVRQIAAFCSVMLPADSRMDMLSLSGPEVAIAPGVDEPASRAALVRQTITYIRNNYHARPCDIVVLSPGRSSNPNSTLSLIPELDAPPSQEREHSAQARERLRRCRQLGAKQILGDTIRSFKGLEAPFVILTDLPATSEAPLSHFTRNDLYVACTRARFGLVIIPTKEAEEEIKYFLKESRPLILPE